MSASTSPRPPFHAVDTSSAGAVLSSATLDDVESPSLSSSNALARFEFEPGRSKEGTKVLMVEWEDDDTTRSIAGDWEISWEGKRTVLPAREQADSTTRDTNATDVPVNRLYFLLGAGVAVPTTVRLQKGTIVWRTNPLPAIFSPELGATARAAGKKGVLHTIWAKKRLQVLQKEIDAEARDNMEGVGFEMASAEKEWIEANFGVVSKPSLVMPAQHGTGTLNSPTSPKSPGGGRLMEKLKGLRIGTTTDALSPSGSASKPAIESIEFNPLSPESSDVAVGSFGAFAALKGMPDQNTLAAKPAQPPTTLTASAPQLGQPQQRRVQAHNPPDSFAAQQRQAGLGSLNALASTGTATGGFSSFEEATFARPPPPSHSSSGQDEDDLFALPMSPRSPEMTKSPFSFAASDVGRYLKEGKSSVAM
jgi:hypothetical protein